MSPEPEPRMGEVEIMPTYCTAEDRRREGEIGQSLAKSWGLRWVPARDINSTFDGMLTDHGENAEIRALLEIKQRDIKFALKSLLLSVRKRDALVRIAGIYQCPVIFAVYLKNEQALVWVNLARTIDLPIRMGGRTMTTRADAAHDIEPVIDIPFSWFQNGAVRP